MRNLPKRDGFTMIELMIVVVIIGILAAIAIPKFTSVSDSAKQAEAEPVLKQICSLAEAEYLKSNAWPAKLADIASFSDPGAKYFKDWAFASGKASATKIPTSLKSPSMDCTTKVVTWS